MNTLDPSKEEILTHLEVAEDQLRAGIALVNQLTCSDDGGNGNNPDDDILPGGTVYPASIGVAWTSSATA